MELDHVCVLLLMRSVRNNNHNSAERSWETETLRMRTHSWFGPYNSSFL